MVGNHPTYHIGVGYNGYRNEQQVFLSLYFSVHIVFKFEVQSSIYPKVNGRVILEAARARGSEVFKSSVQEVISF